MTDEQRDKGTGANSRFAACEIVARWVRTDLFPDRLIAPGTDDRAFVMEVVYGVARRRRTLEWIMARCAKREPDPQVAAYILCGLYQLFLMDSVVDHAAVNETVEAAKKKEPVRRAAGFVNAVLRRAQRDRDTINKQLSEQSLGIRQSHPDELLARWEEVYGRERVEELCLWNNERPHVTITPNPLKTNMDTFGLQLHEGGVEATRHPHDPGRCFVIPHGHRVTALPGFTDGLFSVRDPSTLTAVDLLNPKPGERILDACAAPGGKTILIAERMGGVGELVATDIYKDRQSSLQSNLARMDMEWVQTAVANAGDEQDLHVALGSSGCDAVLVDAPCTNTGVLRRRPDARWRFSVERLTQMCKMQHVILSACAAQVSPGGRVVYSTCSMEPEENEQLVKHWLEDHPSFSLVKSTALFPTDTDTDGAYAALLRREP